MYADPEQKKAYDRSRRWHRRMRRHIVKATRYGGPVFIVTKRDWERLVARYGGCCAYCDDRPEGGLEMDHVRPLERGGAHSIGNILSACRTCNASKQHFSLREWRRRQTWFPDEEEF